MNKNNKSNKGKKWKLVPAKKKKNHKKSNHKVKRNTNPISISNSNPTGNIIVNETGNNIYKLSIPENNFEYPNQLESNIRHEFILDLSQSHVQMKRDDIIINASKYNNLLIFEAVHIPTKINFFFVAHNNKVSDECYFVKFLFVRDDFIYVIQNGIIYKITIHDMINCIKNDNKLNFIHVDQYFGDNINFCTTHWNNPVEVSFFVNDKKIQQIIKLDSKNFVIIAGYYNGKIYCSLQGNFPLPEIRFPFYYDDYGDEETIVVDENGIMTKDDIIKIFGSEKINNNILSPLLRNSVNVLQSHHVKYFHSDAKLILFNLSLIKKYHAKHKNRVFILPMGIIFMIMYYII